MKNRIKLFIIIITLVLFTFTNGDINKLINFYINCFNIKIKVHGKNNLKYFDRDRIIIMSNHYNGIDYGVIKHTINYYTNKKKRIYTIVKHNLFGDKVEKNTISNMLSLMKNDLYNKFEMLPYKKNNKNSGEIIKKNIIKLINNNNTVLLFPDGTTRKYGIPQEFKPGSFKLCAENNIKILPITLKFNKNIGLDKNDSLKLLDWFDLQADIYIHEPIYDPDWQNLRNIVFETIKLPLK